MACTPGPLLYTNPVMWVPYQPHSIDEEPQQGPEVAQAEASKVVTVQQGDGQRGAWGYNLSGQTGEMKTRSWTSRYALRAPGNEGSSWSKVHLIQVLTSLATDLRKHKPYGYMWLQREAERLRP